jgi:NAD(P)-dependent dehydrogenase (short-subunit alcohol dehydrogenase family)
MSEEGATVVAAARRTDALTTLCDEIGSKGGVAHAVLLDVSNLDAYEAALKETATRFGRLDILVHNAMSGRFRLLSETTLAEWREDQLVNADAAFIANREAMRIMAAQGGGSIINISTLAAVRSIPGLGSYGASKAAMIRLTESAAVEAASANVRVNCVVPGTIDTESMRASFGNDPQIASASAATVPMRRFGTPTELANAVVFLASDEASYITGVSLLVDGGKYAAG